MSWPAARAALLDALEDVDEVTAVFAAPPASGEALRNGVTAMLVPPARASSRTPGGRTEKVYTTDIIVMALLASDGVRASTLVDDAVEAIDAAMESHITLGGTATTTGAIAWSAATVDEYPPGSGLWYVNLRGTMPITIIASHDRSP